MKEVEAVKSKSEIDVIENQLRTWNGSLYGDIWRIGVNLSLRISDLLSIRYSDLDLVNRLLSVQESKTGKSREIRLNSKVVEIVNRRRAEHPSDVWLFQGQSNRNSHKPVSRVTVARIFAAVGTKHGIRLGTHSMRKSRGWAMWSDGVPIEKIAKVLNHSEPSVTMRYLGISKEEILQTYVEYQL